MSAEKLKWDQKNFDRLMKESFDELQKLRTELQNLMVRFGLRALKTYQAARKEPLRSTEITSLVKYELKNVIHDVSEQSSKDAIIKQTKLEWEKR